MFGPEIDADDSVFVHETALVYGRVRLAEDVSIWPYVVIRSELHEVCIGARTNVQDFVLIHIGFDHPVLIGEDCSITHHATLHGCTIGDRTLVGINATVMDGVTVGANSVIAGHAILPENATYPNNSIIAGVPGKVVATRDCGESNLVNARFYRQNARNYRIGQHRFSERDIAAFKAS
ncbi:MAG: gamma carbonic anhydrase family protein [Pseudomonadota bacterium]